MKSSPTSLFNAEFELSDIAYMVLASFLTLLIGWKSMDAMRVLQWYDWLDLWFILTICTAGGGLFGRAGQYVFLVITIGAGTTYLVYTPNLYIGQFKVAISIFLGFLV